MIRWCAGILFLVTATAAMADEPPALPEAAASAAPIFAPEYVGIVTGETRQFTTVLNRTYWWPQSVRNPSPEIARVGTFSRSDWGNSGYIAWSFPITGVTSGTVVLDLVMTDGKYTQIYVSVDDCAAFPKVPPLTTVYGRIGNVTRVYMNDAYRTQDEHYVPIEWYAGPIGDLSGPVISRELYLEFTPTEPKAYHFWFRIYDRCAVGTGEVIIDASPPPRRHSVKR